MNQRQLQGISHVSAYVFDDRKCNSRQKWNNDKCQYERKKL